MPDLSELLALRTALQGQLKVAFTDQTRPELLDREIERQETNLAQIEKRLETLRARREAINEAPRQLLARIAELNKQIKRQENQSKIDRLLELQRELKHK